MLVMPIKSFKTVLTAAAAAPGLYPLGGRSQGGLSVTPSESPISFSSSTFFICLGAVAAGATVPPDVFTRLVWATRSKNRRSSLFYS